VTGQSNSGPHRTVECPPCVVSPTIIPRLSSWVTLFQLSSFYYEYSKGIYIVVDAHAAMLEQPQKYVDTGTLAIRKVNLTKRRVAVRSRLKLNKGVEKGFVSIKA
jgi:hypothetical protein